MDYRPKNPVAEVTERKFALDKFCRINGLLSRAVKKWVLPRAKVTAAASGRPLLHYGRLYRKLVYTMHSWPWSPAGVASQSFRTRHE